MADLHTLTIDELWRLCVEKRKQGQGKKKILISGDDEGNSFHELYYGFTPTTDPNSGEDFFDALYIDKPYGITDDNIDEYIVLG